MKYALKFYTLINILTNNFLTTKNELTNNQQNFKEIVNTDKTTMFINTNNISIYNYGQKKGKIFYKTNLVVSKVIVLNWNLEECQLDRKIGRYYPFRTNHTKKWYFNYNLKRCIQFHYSGAGGNVNNFNTCLDCLNRCYYVGVK